MSFSLGPKGGIQDPQILRLLARLTTLVKEHGFQSAEVASFINTNGEIITVDELSHQMHSFREIAEGLGPLIEGIKNPDMIPGDGWRFGSAERIFQEKDPNEPADWWKNS